LTQTILFPDITELNFWEALERRHRTFREPHAPCEPRVIYRWFRISFALCCWL